MSERGDGKLIHVNFSRPKARVQQGGLEEDVLACLDAFKARLANKERTTLILHDPSQMLALFEHLAFAGFVWAQESIYRGRFHFEDVCTREQFESLLSSNLAFLSSPSLPENVYFPDFHGFQIYVHPTEGVVLAGGALYKTSFGFRVNHGYVPDCKNTGWVAALPV
jgi:hypothetical protein